MPGIFGGVRAYSAIRERQFLRILLHPSASYYPPAPRFLAEDRLLRALELSGTICYYTFK